MKIQELSSFDIEVKNSDEQILYKGNKDSIDSQMLSMDILEVDMNKDCIVLYI